MFVKPTKGRRVEDMREVVVTAIGAITPLGLSWPETWANLITGESGIGPITRFDATQVGLKTTIAAEVTGFNPDTFMNPKWARTLDLFSQYAVAAALEAANSLGLNVHEGDPRRGCIIGTGVGGINTIVEQVGALREKGPGRVHPFTVPKLMPNAASANAAIALNAWATSIAPTSACASGADAIGLAYQQILWDEADIIFAGASEAAITPITIAGFNQARALSTHFNDQPRRASRPFDGFRDGFVMGEGAVLLALEEKRYAEAQKHRILAKLVGYGSTTDASHITAPPEDGRGAILAMQKALKSAGLEPCDVDYINAHGTSTPLNDKAETQAIKAVFGTRAYEIPISSTKGQTGHMVSAGGPMEAAICVYSLITGNVLPTINQEEPDPECDLDYVPNQSRLVFPRTAMSNTFGFGGHNACLILAAV